MINLGKKMRIVVALAAITAGALGAYAAGTGTTPGVTQSPAAAAEVASLRTAFTTLEGADHDYKGHRVKAMHAIAAACRLLGTDILPPGTGRKPETATSMPHHHPTTEPEAQGTSDAQLKQAQATVQQVRSGIAAGTQPRVAAHLDEAIQELTIALSVK